MINSGVQKDLGIGSVAANTKDIKGIHAVIHDIFIFINDNYIVLLCGKTFRQSIPDFSCADNNNTHKSIPPRFRKLHYIITK